MHMIMHMHAFDHMQDAHDRMQEIDAEKMVLTLILWQSFMTIYNHNL